MPHPTVLVEMSMRFTGLIPGAVRMVMMFVVHVRVRMTHWLVKMLVFVMFGEV